VSQIVTSLLDFARQSKPAKARHDINQVVRDSMALAESKPLSRTSLLRPFSLSHCLWWTVDKDQIQQCLINLAINGIDATDPGGKIRFAKPSGSRKTGG